MDPFTRVTGVAAPLLRSNVDTDQIAPGRVIVKMDKVGAGAGLFANWRFGEAGAANAEFVLNQPPFDKATFLVAGPNFGCGSSREFAVWALADFGIRAILAPSFGAIFANNCYANGVLPVALPDGDIAAIADEILPDRALMTVDLEALTITTSGGRALDFAVPPLQREMLLAGVDAVQLTLRRADQIDRFQAADAARRPWVYQV